MDWMRCGPMRRKRPWLSRELPVACVAQSPPSLTHKPSLQTPPKEPPLQQSTAAPDTSDTPLPSLSNSAHPSQQCKSSPYYSYPAPPHLDVRALRPRLTHDNRVRTLTGKEIELDIEPDYKVRFVPLQLYGPWIPRGFYSSSRTSTCIAATDTNAPLRSPA